MSYKLNQIVPFSESEEQVFNDMTRVLHGKAVNPVVFCAFQRHKRIFEKVGEINDVKGTKLNLADMNQGLEIMGLKLDAGDLPKAIAAEGKEPNVVEAKTTKVDDVDIEEMDEKTPFDYEIAFDFAIKNLSEALENFNQSYK